jgi:hypothetical protein
MDAPSPVVHTLHQVAVHIVARARQQATGRFSLRITPGGFGTPEFGADSRRVRVAGGSLLAESDAAPSPTVAARAIHGASLRELAELAAVDLTRPIDVGRDTPELGDADAPLALDAVEAADVASWFGVVAAALDRVVEAVPAAGRPTLARLWPEHFDASIDVAARSDLRVNLGGSPGDSYVGQPYLYVGPFTAERPGDEAFWNAPFGAARTRAELDPNDPVGSAASFLLDGFRRLAQQG